MPPPHPKVCAVSPVRASVGRRLAAGEAATAEESATADAWYDEWAVRLECWLLSLPPLPPASFTNCRGALQLHLANRLDSLLKAAGGAAAIAGQRGAADAAVASECEWFREAASVEWETLPQFPDLPTVPRSLELTLPLTVPVVPRQLVPSPSRLQWLLGMDKGVPSHDDTASIPPRRHGASAGAQGALFIGVAAGAIAGLVVALGAAGLVWPWRRARANIALRRRMRS